MTLAPQLRSALVRNNTLIPTEIQQRSMDRLIAGESAILVAETGSGKTLSYVLPVLTRALARGKVERGQDEEEPGEEEEKRVQRQPRQSPQSLIIAPTTDLARQIYTVVSNYAVDLPIRHHLLMPHEGSSSIFLPKNLDVAVTTFPMLQQIKHVIPTAFKETETVVIDEVDWVFGDGYRNSPTKPVEIFDAIRLIRPRKQFIFACATLPKGPASARQLILNRMPRTSMIASSGSHQLVSSLTQHFIDIQDDERASLKKLDELVQLIKEDRRAGAKLLVFGNSIRSITEAYNRLSAELEKFPNLADRIDVHRLYHSISVTDRQQLLESFASVESSRMQVLLTTDVLARGFDFPNVDRVVQLDFATNVVTYLHRVGRTARAGRPGEVVHFVAPTDKPFVDMIREAIEAGELDEKSDDERGNLDEKRLSKLFSRKRSLREKLKRRNPTAKIEVAST